METKMCLIYSTFENEDEAKRAGKTLVEENLAACINIIPRIHSIYRWKDRVEEAKEAVLIAKTTKDKATDAVAEIKNLHNYEMAAILVVPVIGGLEEFITYVHNEVT